MLRIQRHLDKACWGLHVTRPKFLKPRFQIPHHWRWQTYYWIPFCLQTREAPHSIKFSTGVQLQGLKHSLSLKLVILLVVASSPLSIPTYNVNTQVVCPLATLQGVWFLPPYFPKNYTYLLSKALLSIHIKQISPTDLPLFFTKVSTILCMEACTMCACF